MRGVKDKGERSGSQRSGGNGASSGGGCVAETGALFPRLHVKEANKSGPRAPPRNKMALYEQFTFPSHRFVPPSAPPPAAERPAVTTSTTTSTYCPQPSSYEGSLFYGSPPTFQGMPWMPYSAMNTRSYHGGQPSVNASSSSTVLDCEGELQQRPSSNASGPWSPWTSSNLYGTNISSKRARNNDDCTVPSYHKPEASSHVPVFPTKGSDQFTWQGWQHHSADAAPARRPTPISSDHRVESLGPRKLRTTRDDGGKNREITRKVGNQDQGEEEQSELQESTVVQKEKDSTTRHNSFAEHSDSQCRSSQYFKRQHRQKKDSQLEVASDVQGSKSCATVNVESLTVPESGKVCGLQKWKTSHKERRRASECSQMSESPPTNTVERAPGKKEKRVGQATGVQEVNKEANPSECRSSSSAGSGDDVESVSGPDNSEVSQPNEVWSDGAESDAGDTSAAEPECRRRGSIIASRDIVNLIGEQEFWRTRKLLLRQQKVFSTQVFELHRIIKVQQLLASSPVMNEGTVASAGEEGAAMVDLELADMVEREETDMVDLGRADMVTLDRADMLDLDEVDHAQEADDVAEDTEAFVGDQETSKDAPVMELDSTGFSSTIDKVCLQPPVLNSQPGQYNTGQVPLMPNVAPGVSSAVWGCPPFAKAGVNNWFGTVPAPNGAYMYPPYAGSFHPRPLHTTGAYNGAYHPVMCTPGAMDAPPLTPYGVPRYEQRPDLMQDMYQYNSYQQQQWQAAMFCPPVSANPVPGWYGVPPPVPYMDPTVRPPYGWYDEMALRSHPPGPYVRPAHQNKAHPMLAPHASAFVPPQSSWPGSSNGQEAVHEAGRFRQHSQWSPSAETGQAARPPTSCGQDFAHPVADSPGPYGPCQASAPTFQRPLPNSAGQDCDISSSQQQEAEGNGKCGWQPSDGTQERGCGPTEEPITANHVSADKSLKRSRDSRQVVKHTWDKESSRHTIEGSNLADSQRDARHTLEGSYLAESQRDALPLFPLEPALNGTENGTPRNLPSAVIKAVPRALVATAESAAEILLSIQRQRRQ